jgi:transcriptional regulator with XRE-family HTH domain
MSIVTDLENARKAQGITQAALASRAGLSRMTVQRTEAGLDPRLSTLQEMARAMGLELMLVPRVLRSEVEGFVRSGGRMVGQAPGAGAPRSVVDLLAIDAASAPTLQANMTAKMQTQNPLQLSDPLANSAGKPRLP